MYRGSRCGTGGSGGEDLGAARVKDGEESDGGLTWIIYWWLVAHPPCIRHWHLERERLSASSTVCCRALNEILYRCKLSGMNQVDLSYPIKRKDVCLKMWTWCQKCCSAEVNLLSAQPSETTQQLSNDAFLNAYVMYCSSSHLKSNISSSL